MRVYKPKLFCGFIYLNLSIDIFLYANLGIHYFYEYENVNILKF